MSSISCGGVVLALVGWVAPTVLSAQTAPGVTPGHLEMLRALEQIADDTPDTNQYQGDALARRLRAQVRGLPPGTPDQDMWEVRMQLGGAELRLGNLAEAIEQFTQARAIVGRSQGEIPAGVASDTSFQLGLAYFRLAETQNCVTTQTPDSCILPLGDRGVYTDQDASRQAILHFAEVLRNTPAESARYLEARWLFNISYMTLGGYPDWLPAQYVIPPRVFESQEQIPRFANIAVTLGVGALDTADLSGGAIGDDFDNDGYLDIVVSTMDARGQLRFFRNNQDGTFSERTDQAGLRGLLGGLNLVQADYDNDGNVDILVLRGAWLEQHGQHPNSLVRNNGDGTFTDVTFESGLGAVHIPPRQRRSPTTTTMATSTCMSGTKQRKSFVPRVSCSGTTATGPLPTSPSRRVSKTTASRSPWSGVISMAIAGRICMCRIMVKPTGSIVTTPMVRSPMWPRRSTSPDRKRAFRPGSGTLTTTGYWTSM